MGLIRGVGQISRVGCGYNFFINRHNRLTPEKAMLLSSTALLSGGVLINNPFINEPIGATGDDSGVAPVFPSQAVIRIAGNSQDGIQAGGFLAASPAAMSRRS